MSRWFDFDQEAGEFTYQGTEDHIFAAYDEKHAKRVGDMDRDELIAAMASLFHDREQLARALLIAVQDAYGGPETSVDDAGISSETALAQLIVKRYDA